MDGAIVVDKPEGWTSHDVVARMRRIAQTRRIGHLGTLDPLATGVLPLVLDRATRLAQFYTRSDKKYDACIRFGYATTTYDREGEPTTPQTDPSLDRAQIESLLDELRGPISQVPPAISAKKIGGTPAYKLARKQIAVEIAPVEVTVYSLDIVELSGSLLRVQVHCSGGTYVRSLAHDLGQRLGCGAFVEQLRRVESGEFAIAQAHTLPALEELAREGRFEQAIIPAARLIPAFPCEVVDSVTVNQIRHGRDFRVSPFRVRQGTRHVKALSPAGELVAIGEVKLPNLYHPILVF